MIQVREATRADISVIAAYQVAMAFESEGMPLEPETVIKGVNALMDDPGKGIYYVAYEDTSSSGTLLGTLLVTREWSDWRNGWVLWIQSVYTIPASRRQGVYTALYTHIRDMVLHDDGLRGIRLYADKSNARAQAVYRRLGMTDEHYTTFEWMKAPN